MDYLLAGVFLPALFGVVGSMILGARQEGGLGRLHRLIFGACAVYWLIVIAASVAFARLPEFQGATVDVGPCYTVGTIIASAECVGFPKAALVEAFLNLPVWALLAPIVIPSGLFFIGVPATLVLWGPLLYPLYHVWRRERARRRADAPRTPESE